MEIEKSKKENIFLEAFERITEDEELSQIFNELGKSIRYLRKVKAKAKSNEKSELESSIKEGKKRIREIIDILSKKNYTWRRISNNGNPAFEFNGKVPVRVDSGEVFQADFYITLTEDLFYDLPNRIEKKYQEDFKDESPEECEAKLLEYRREIMNLPALPEDCDNPILERRIKEKKASLAAEIPKRMGKIDCTKKEYDLWKLLPDEDKVLLKEYYLLMGKVIPVNKKCRKLFNEIEIIDRGKKDQEFLETSIQVGMGNRRITKEQLEKVQELIRKLLKEYRLNLNRI